MELFSETLIEDDAHSLQNFNGDKIPRKANNKAFICYVKLFNKRTMTPAQIPAATCPMLAPMAVAEIWKIMHMTPRTIWHAPDVLAEDTENPGLGISGCIRVVSVVCLPMSEQLKKVSKKMLP